MRHKNGRVHVLVLGAPFCCLPFVLHAQSGQITLRVPSVKPQPQPNLSGKHAGTWLLTGQYYASGAPLPPTASLDNNNNRLTVVGEDSGTFVIDEQLRFGDNGRVEISCRGTIRGNFTSSHIGGFNILSQTNAVETTGPACGRMAGQITKLPDLRSIYEISGDTMRVVNGLRDENSPMKTAEKTADMAIFTYKRIAP